MTRGLRMRNHGEKLGKISIFLPQIARRNRSARYARGIEHNQKTLDDISKFYGARIVLIVGL
jgi:hypothetical protein